MCGLDLTDRGEWRCAIRHRHIAREDPPATTGQSVGVAPSSDRRPNGSVRVLLHSVAADAVDVGQLGKIRGRV